MFDVIMSLGYNCEISFRLENFLGKIDAMPFSWSYVLERERFPKVLENMDTLFTGELSLQDDHMIKCENTQIKFHPRYDILRVDGQISDVSYEQAVEELQGRVAHLKDKFANVLNSDKKILFFMKVEDKGNESNIDFVKAVVAVLRQKCKSGRFRLVVLMEKQAITQEILQLEDDCLSIRRLKKFAPRKHTDTMGDVRGWKKVLQEFTGQSGKGYYKRLYQKRIKWFVAVVKKYLHMR